MELPRLRNEEVVIPEINDEILIWDLRINMGLSLNQTTVNGHQSFRGKASFEDLKVKSNLTDTMLFAAFEELKQVSLLEKDAAFLTPFNRAKAPNGDWYFVTAIS